MYNNIRNAGVMELVDVADSKSAAGDSVGVRVPPPAPRRSKRHIACSDFFQKAVPAWGRLKAALRSFAPALLIIIKEAVIWWKCSEDHSYSNQLLTRVDTEVMAGPRQKPVINVVRPTVAPRRKPADRTEKSHATRTVRALRRLVRAAISWGMAS